MSRRNPITGQRRMPEPGDRCIFTLSEGPPALAIQAYGGDVQGAVTAALTLLYLQMQSTAAVTANDLRTLKTLLPDSEPAAVEAPVDPLAAVMAQEMFG